MLFPVTSNAAMAAGKYSQSFIVKNSGKSTVYFGEDSSLTVASRAFSIAPGAVLQWPGKSPLWVVTAPGEVSELEVLYNSQASYTPAPESVSINGPVTVTPGNGSLIYVSSPTTVPSDSGAQLIPGVLSVGKYMSLILTIQHGLTTFDPFTGTDVPYRITVSHLAANGDVIATDVMYNSGQGKVAFVTPVKGERVKVSVRTPLEATNPHTREVLLSVFGSYVTLPSSYSHEWMISGDPWYGFHSAPLLRFASDAQNVGAVDGRVRATTSPFLSGAAFDHTAKAGMVAVARAATTLGNLAVCEYYLRANVIGGNVNQRPVGARADYGQLRPGAVGGDSINKGSAVLLPRAPLDLTMVSFINANPTEFDFQYQLQF